MWANLDVDAALQMLAQLTPETQDLVRRRLALRVGARPLSTSSALGGEGHELRIVAELLRDSERRAGWSFSYVQRRRYDDERPDTSPSSAALVRRYGSWVSVCREANRFNETPETARRTASPKPPEALRPTYRPEDAIAALRECARRLGRPPSVHAYDSWRLAAKRGKRTARRFPQSQAIFRLYAQKGGWRAALEDAGLIECPTTTIRVRLASIEEAAELASVVRLRGLIASHPRNRKWVEIQGTISATRDAIAGTAALVGTVTLWEPQTRTLERIQTGSRSHLATPNSGSQVAPVSRRGGRD
jgi:hypothetical protein